MSAFLHNFNHGFFHGMFNGMFGGPCYAMNPFVGSPFMPNFFMPNCYFGGFYPYQQPMFNAFPTFGYNNFSANFNTFTPFNINSFSQMLFENDYVGYDCFTSSITSRSVTRTKTDVSEPSPEKDEKDADVETETNANELKDKWKDKKPHLTDEFYSKVIDLSKRINCDPNDLMAVMNSESGIKHTAVNKTTNATGLIQFMPKTAKGLGTTVEKLKSMTDVEQLDYVEKYLKKQKKAAGFKEEHHLSPGELYALVFLPGRAKREVLTTSGEKYYSCNKGLDKNKDGKITKDELGTRVRTVFMA